MSDALLLGSVLVTVIPNAGQYERAMGFAAGLTGLPTRGGQPWHAKIEHATAPGAR